GGQTAGGGTRAGGQNFLNLRSLGNGRTLVLLDGRRFTPSGFDNLIDVNLFPQGLVQRVDVVTGGASAAYGSDAVSGVVNFILDTKFEGIKASAQAGISQYGDNFNYRVSVTGGMSFLDDRLHVVGSILDYKSTGVTFAQSRPWTAKGVSSITNPNFNKNNPVSPTNSALMVVTQPYSSVATLGGLITQTTTLAGVTSGNTP